MKIKIGKDARYSFVIFLALLTTMQLEMSRIILLGILIFLFVFTNYLKRDGVKVNSLSQIQKICRIEILCLVVFSVLQIIVLGLNVREIAMDIGILSCVYIGIICGAICVKPYKSFETYLKAILVFLIVFSSYYIIDILLYGLPEGRNSALGNVSSNYCSAILYLNYPIIFYYLYAKRKKNRNLVKLSYIAILLSMIVIASSGSRTAIGVVALMLAQMVLYKQEKIKDKLKYIAIVLVGIVVLFFAYSFNASVQELMDRALDAFGGKSTLDNNVRQLIWAAGLQQFRNGNIVFGLGTSIVTRFDRSAHNLFYEVLMCSGYLGMLLFTLTIGCLLTFLLKNQQYQQRFFSVMLLISCVIVAIVQPFFSTSYTCGLMVWMSLFAFTADAERRV